MSLRVALAGGTGFTGRKVAARLAALGATIRCLVRERSDVSALPPDATRVTGDLADPAALRRWLDGVDTVVYCASMGFGHVAGVVDSCIRASVRRALFVSTTAIFTRLPTHSKVVRLQAEKVLQATPIDWTIVRPTMIYGAPGDRNMERLLRAIDRWPLVPVPGDGRSLIQPVHVEDLADGIVAALLADTTRRRTYEMSGREPLSLDETINAAARALGRKRRKVYLPLRPAVAMLGLGEILRIPLPVRAEQVLRLAEDKAFSHADAQRDFGYAPRAFQEGIADEARLVRLSRRRAFYG